MCYEQKDTGNLMEGEQGLGSSEEDDTRMENAAADVNNEHRVANQTSNGMQISQQSQNSVIRWERFLPIRSLKVLLVENDDSTRHVVSALLRNCSYEVTAVPNGFQAWRILEDINNHTDLVLTEVVMPVLSGIGLLCKIMNHKSLKNIPVIMMSSQDSIGVVFKCLSKGAVDFLVKPIRKNELKNLWQHVWRRCHSSSGSGSESGTGKSPKSKSNEESENNSDSSEELEDNGSNGQSNCDGSDNGSGTQSSWTKRAAEYDSPQALSPSYQLADAPDSTCAQVIHAKPETLGNRWVHEGKTKVCQQKDEKLDDVTTGKDLETGTSRNAEIQQRDCPCENLSSQTSSRQQNKFSEADSKLLENGQIEHNAVNVSTKTREPSPKAIGIITNYMDPHAESEKFCDLNGVSDVSQLKDKSHSGCGESPCLELGLKRPGGVEGVNAARESLSVLKHSDLSAFSKYNTASSANQGPTGNVGSCSPLDQRSAAIKTETVHNFPFPISGTVVNQQSNGSSNNNDMASTAKNVPTKLEAFSDKLESSSAFKSFHSSAFQPVQNGRTSPPQKVVLGNSEDVDIDTVQLKFRGSHQRIQVQHHHHHHHHYHHHVHKMQQHQPQSDHDDQSLKNMAAAAPQCGSSNVLGGPTEANAGNYSMNGSASGSNHGSNGQNGGSTPLNVGLTNVESEHRAAGNSAVGGVGGKTSGNVLDEDRAAQREAALSKFRQKRKERCFEKRVRYQSRKRLAEQRPRVKGQFVRQIASDSKTERDCQSNYITSEDNSSDNVR